MTKPLVSLLPLLAASLPLILVAAGHCRPTAGIVSALALAAIPTMDAAWPRLESFHHDAATSPAASAGWAILLPLVLLADPPLAATAFLLWCWCWSWRNVPPRSDPLRALPREVMAHVAAFWSENEVVAVRRVSRDWRDVGTTEAMRKKHDRNIEFKKYEDGKRPITVQDLGDGTACTDVAVTPDGTVFVSNFNFDQDRGDIQIYDSEHRHLRTLDSGDVFCLCIGPGGDEIYVGSFEEIHAWRFDGTLVRTLTVPTTAAIWCLTFGRDRELYGGSWDGVINVWDADGGHIRTWQGHECGVRCLAASPQSDGVLYSGGGDKRIKKWCAAGRCLRVFEGHTGPVNALVFGPGRDKLYSSSYDRSVRVWSPDGKPLRTFDEGHMGAVYCLTFSPEGRLYSGSGDKAIKVWSADGKLLRTLRGHDDEVASLAFHPDGSKLYSGSDDGTVKEW